MRLDVVDQHLAVLARGITLYFNDGQTGDFNDWRKLVAEFLNRLDKTTAHSWFLMAETKGLIRTTTGQAKLGKRLFTAHRWGRGPRFGFYLDRAKTEVKL